MAKNEPLRRYFIEINRIERKDFPSLKELVETLSEKEIYKAERTVERDIQEIRKNFGIEIVYDPQERGYNIDGESSPSLKPFLHFLELANTAQLFISGITETKDFLEDIDFDEKGGLKGIMNLQPILEGIKEKRRIHFTHINYHNNEIKEVLFNPYFLKEYMGRWYVVGIRDDNKIRTYGIDRISEIEVRKEKFKKTNAQKVRDNFDRIIGLVYSYHKQQKVILSFTPMQGRYIKSLPWHRTQEIIIDNEQECRISLFIIPNYELYQQILMHGPEVKVVEPKWLAEEIKNKYKESINRYK